MPAIDRPSGEEKPTIRRTRWRLTAVAAAAALLVPLAPVAAEPVPASSTRVSEVADALGAATYAAEIRRTEFGVPHIKADDLPSVAFGAGFAFAEDNACVLLEQMVNVRARRSMTFGATTANRNSDLFHARIRDNGRLEALLAGELGPAPSEEVRVAVRGYVDGFNHYLDVTGADGITDPACSGADWVVPLTEMDVWRYYNTVLMRAGEAAVLDAIASAQPPAAAAAAAGEPMDPSAGLDLDDAALDELADYLADRLLDGGPVGSNAYALGAEATAKGTGMVLGNPHFPWQGPQRFYRMHLTVPGELDVTGASLFGLPIVNIGHNEHVGWSHTVSTANRFTLHLLQLVPGSPTSYLVDGEVREMQPLTVSIEVPGADGEPETVEHTFWESHLGPVVAIPPLTWSQSIAVVMKDVNAVNGRAPDAWLDINRAGSIEELLDALDRHQGIPWVNTIAADSSGAALYADHSVVPNLDAATVADCGLLVISGLTLLDGARSECEPGDDPEAVAGGILGPSKLPVLVRDDYATNMNNSHWLANPEAPLEGFTPLIGSERSNIGLRARLGLLMVQERLDGTDGLEGTGFTLEQLQTVMFNNRNLGAELVRDDLVEACRDAGQEVDVDGTMVDLAEACDVLEAWDLRVDLDSRGAHVFREFARFGGIRFATPFDVAAPLTTPNTLDVGDARVLGSLGQAVARLEAAGVPLDVRLGDLQSVTRNGVTTPIHGGPGGEGIFNVITAGWNAAAGGYPEVTHGASFVMTVELTPDGPVSEALLTYSQSTDPTSPHFADQVPLYSEKRWVPMRFREEEILADPALTVTQLPIRPPGPPSFSDVDPDGVHTAAIERLAAEGILLGFPDGTFRPWQQMQRGQVAMVVARALELDGVADGPFSDVTGDSERTRAINAVAAAGLVSGFEDGTFRPDATISRGQLASVVARALELDDLPTGPFPDVVGSVHAGAINALAEAGIVDGFVDGTFRPGAPISRAQVASLVDRALMAGR
jgi:acyl-homoserine-lactone acylase